MYFSIQHQGLGPLARPDYLSMRRVIILYIQPIRFARFDNESMNRDFWCWKRPEVSMHDAD